MSEQRSYDEWSIMELMGHRRLAGKVTEQEVAGAGLLRIDVYTDGDTPVATQFYSPSALYCLTPVTEEIARAVAKRNQPEPVQRWELPAPVAMPTAPANPYYDTGRDEDDDGTDDDDLDNEPPL